MPLETCIKNAYNQTATLAQFWLKTAASLIKINIKTCRELDVSSLQLHSCFNEEAHCFLCCFRTQTAILTTTPLIADIKLDE